MNEPRQNLRDNVRYVSLMRLCNSKQTRALQTLCLPNVHLKHILKESRIDRGYLTYF